MDISEFNLTECCKVGLMHTASGRFLTIEVFNNDINVSGTTMRKRQVWTLLVNPALSSDTEIPVVYWLSPFGRLLSADKDGKVSCSTTQPTKDEEFILEFNPSGNGELALRSNVHGYYLNGNETQVSCFSKTVRWWVIRLANHPQINVKNLFRNRYAHLHGNKSELRCDLAQPWDQESVLRLVQLPLPTSGPVSKVHRYGQVAICTESGQLCDQGFQYLAPDGSLVDQVTDQCMFSLEIRPGAPTLFSFRHVESGAYLSAVGQGTLKTKSNQNASTRGKEEMFIIERAACQVAVLAYNDKFVSMKQGVEILANQRELNDTETFQLEYLGGSGLDVQKLLQTSLTKEVCEANNNNLTAADSLNGLAPKPGLANGTAMLVARKRDFYREKDTEFEMYCIISDWEKPGAFVLQSKGSKQTLTAKKLGAVSCTGGPTSLEEETPRKTDEFFRIYPFVNRNCLIVQAAITGGFLSRNPVQSKTKLVGVPLDCTGQVWEQFRVRHVPASGAIQLYANPKTGSQKKTYERWFLSESGLCLQPTEIALDQELEELEEAAEAGTEFVFYFLGEGRCFIRPVNCSFIAENSFCLLKAEPKGDVRLSQPGDITPNCVWEV
ncbi:Fascin [Cichlidogyrus casuarinus]|uniref:Fascin n=1 Tax=Cichlidogyrus casuarinus TaxID=1844966 RepID=A0ABD2Q4K0_9PLAT